MYLLKPSSVAPKNVRKVSVLIHFLIRANACNNKAIQVRVLTCRLNSAEPINLLKPTGHVMHHQFNIQQLYALPTKCIYVFCMDLRTNSDLCHLQHKMIGFYNQDEKCLQHGK